MNGSAVAWRGVGPVVTLKLLVQPLVAFLPGRFLLHLDGHALFAAVLFAGLPTAQNTYVYAWEIIFAQGSRDPEHARSDTPPRTGSRRGE